MSKRKPANPRPPDYALRPKQHLAIEYLTNPSYVNMPYKAIAEKLNIHKRTLYRWQNCPIFIRHLNYARTRLFEEHRKKVDARLFEKAVEGQMEAMKLFYRLIGPLPQPENNSPAGIQIIIEHVYPDAPSSPSDNLGNPMP